MKMRYKLSGWLLTLVCALTLAGCGNSDKEFVSYDPVAFHSDDECHVCGMIIADFDGPKGQVVDKDGVKKFCSTAELLGWWLQPENKIRQARLYVHDMGKSPWDKPDDNYLIDATQAWYVAGTPLTGAMGASLASFADQHAAETFAEQYEGAQVVSFDQIDQAFLQKAAAAQAGADSMSHHPEHAHSHHPNH